MDFLPKAKELGKQARAIGKLCVPADDPDIKKMSMVVGREHIGAIVRAWMDGWFGR